MSKTSSTEIEILVAADDAIIIADPLLQQLIVAAQEAVRAALREHKCAGNSIAAWQDGKVVLLPPERIEV